MEGYEWGNPILGVGAVGGGRGQGMGKGLSTEDGAKVGVMGRE